MSTRIDALHLRRTWGRDEWLVPEPFGPDGWRMVARDRRASVIVTCDDFEGAEWLHASIALDDEMPSYEDLATLHRSIWRDRGEAYQVFVPPSRHVNIHEYALHLWGRRDGVSVLPDFGITDSI